MPVFTIKDIAEKCSMEPKNIHTYIGRGKLIKRKDGLIDTTNIVNKEFLLKYQVLDKKDEDEVKIPAVIESKEPKISSKSNQSKATQSNKKENDSDVDENLKAFVTANTLNGLKAEKTRWEIEILKLKSKVQSGDLIPISIAENVTTVHFNSITAVFYNSIDNQISDICNELGVEREKLTTIRGKLKQILNDSVSKAKEKSRKDLISAAEHYEEAEVESE